MPSQPCVTVAMTNQIATCLLLLCYVTKVQAWKYSYQSDDDHNVLTIFLPILAVAILLCAVGCCYMEKRRRKRLKKNGGVIPEVDVSDTESVMTTSSSRYRPYLLPSTTTGRTYRSSSRTGSSRGGGAYDLESNYGEPPPYNGARDSMHRSKSMLDVRNNQAPQNQPIRRSRSSLSLNRYNDVTNQQQGKSPSPAMSEWSVRTAPPGEFPPRPSSVRSLPVGNRKSNLRRSASQPNLSGGARRTGTYPQGILKSRQMEDDVKATSSYNTSHTATSQDSGMYDRDYQDSVRSQSRPQSAYGGSGYYPESYQGAYPQPRNPPGYDDQQIYSVTRGSNYPPYSGSRGAEWTGAYTAGYDPYGYGQGQPQGHPQHGYWDDSNSYAYGSAIY